MGERSSLHEDFMRVKPLIGLEQFELGKKLVRFLNSSRFTKELVVSQNKTLHFFFRPGI